MIGEEEKAKVRVALERAETALRALSEHLARTPWGEEVPTHFFGKCIASWFLRDDDALRPRIAPASWLDTARSLFSEADAALRDPVFECVRIATRMRMVADVLDGSGIEWMRTGFDSFLQMQRKQDTMRRMWTVISVASRQGTHAAQDAAEQRERDEAALGGAVAVYWLLETEMVRLALQHELPDVRRHLVEAWGIVLPASAGVLLTVLTRLDGKFELRVTTDDGAEVSLSPLDPGPVAALVAHHNASAQTSFDVSACSRLFKQLDEAGATQVAALLKGIARDKEERRRVWSADIPDTIAFDEERVEKS